MFKQLPVTVSLVLLVCSLPVAAQDFKVTLLGTGTPIPRIERFGPATLVEVGGQKLLFDAGRGASQRLFQMSIPLNALDAVFLTHFHHDHLIGLSDIWMTGWLPPPWGRRIVPFEVWGPTGTASLLKNLEEAYALNTSIRIPNELLPPAGIEMVAHEFETNGAIYEKDGVKVTAFAVDHGELIKPAYGYRIDYDGRAVVISGDTRFDRNLIAAAKGADLIIHEVVLASDELLASSEQFRRIAAHHTTPEEAGMVFAEVAPKLAVYSHLVSLSSRTIPEAPLPSLITRTRTNYDGPLVVGEDLMSFVVGDTVSMAMGADDALLERGTYLVETITACGNCHSPKDPQTAEVVEGMDYAGSFMIREDNFTAYAPNITMDIETGIGGWTDDEIIVAIRDGFRPDGSLVRPPMPVPFYQSISDYDARAIVAYMRTIKPVKNIVPESEYRMALPPNYGPKVGRVPDVSKDDPIAYGKYVTHTLGHCTGCHTPRNNGKLDFSRTNIGGRIFDSIYGLGFVAVSMNITPHPVAGIGEWSDEEIKRAITQGISRNGRKLAGVMAFPYYANLSEEDLDAIVAYLRSLPPLSASVSPSETQ